VIAAAAIITTAVIVGSSPSIVVTVPVHRTWNRNRDRDRCEETTCRADGDDAQE
jgi:hypothetical protein